MNDDARYVKSVTQIDSPRIARRTFWHTLCSWCPIVSKMNPIRSVARNRMTASTALIEKGPVILCAFIALVSTGFLTRMALR